MNRTRLSRYVALGIAAMAATHFAHADKPPLSPGEVGVDAAEAGKSEVAREYFLKIAEPVMKEYGLDREEFVKRLKAGQSFRKELTFEERCQHCRGFKTEIAPGGGKRPCSKCRGQGTVKKPTTNVVYWGGKLTPMAEGDALAPVKLPPGTHAAKDLEEVKALCEKEGKNWSPDGENRWISDEGKLAIYDKRGGTVTFSEPKPIDGLSVRNFGITRSENLLREVKADIQNFSRKPVKCTAQVTYYIFGRDNVFRRKHYSSVKVLDLRENESKRIDSGCRYGPDEEIRAYRVRIDAGGALKDAKFDVTGKSQ